MKKLPRFLKKYFWDVDFEKIDSQKSSIYIIERILEYGDDRAIKWLFGEFKTDLIKTILKTQRGFSPKTARFWASFLGIDERKVACLQTPYLKMRQTHWPY